MSRAWTGRWIAAWIGAAAIATANGAVREATYGRRIYGRNAQNLSGVILVAALASYLWNLHRRWPIPSSRDAARIGLSWVALTLTFEFGLGLLQKQSWREMLAAYNLAKGETWPLVLVWIGIGPVVVRRLQSRTETGG